MAILVLGTLRRQGDASAGKRALLGWPSAPVGGWESSRQHFIADLERAVGIGSDEAARARRIEPPIEFAPLANYTIAEAITHVAVHNAHHLGQIVTLRQILGTWPPPGGS